MSVFGAFEEIFNPAGAQAARDWEEERDHVRPAPVPSGGEDDGVGVDLEGGLVVVPVPADQPPAVLPERIRPVRDDEGTEEES